MSKSPIVFSRNTPQLVRMEVATTLGVLMVDKHDNYLGLPLVLGKSKWAAFDRIKDRIWPKMQCWSAKNLCQVGCTVMIKSVLQAIPTYSMSCFKLPEMFLKEVESLLAAFFWKQEAGKTIH
ncbi:UNVERIFIED_CONTAM: hypothetical protein Slati_2125900 [Sesamum latifolium]|uniref:Reverse transcriptase n=1 Tax=Sesamum latifolium TaxID=2727402 RepID=A0AAW2WU16_9LAMI